MLMSCPSIAHAATARAGATVAGRRVRQREGACSWPAARRNRETSPPCARRTTPERLVGHWVRAAGGSLLVGAHAA